MKKFMLVAMVFAASVIGAAVFEVGYSPDAFANGTRCVAAILVSTNAAQTATVKAVYEFPTWAAVDRYNVRYERRQVLVDHPYAITNWCGNVTTNYVVIGGVTNYYDSVNVGTNKVPVMIDIPTTNHWEEVQITGKKTVTNDLYSLTASGGFGQSTDTKLIGRGAGILVTGAAVELITE